MQGDQQLFEALAKIDPRKPYGTTLFNAIARLTVSPAVETVCLRLNQTTKEVEVYLVQRARDDTAYPGEWHCPGSVLRPGEDFKDAFGRLAKCEFGGIILSMQFVANANVPTESRGHFLSLVYLCVLDDTDGLRGKWFPINQLPDKTVEHHRHRIIPVAVGAFVAENTKICD